MTGEERANVVSLKEHVEQRFVENEKAQKMFARVLDERLNGMNEFREDLRRQAATFISRQEFGVLHERIVEDIKSLRESRAGAEGAASVTSVFIAYILAGLSLIVGIAALLISLQ